MPGSRACGERWKFLELLWALYLPWALCGDASPRATGAQLFVDCDSGSDTNNNGLSIASPLQTIDQALVRLQARNSKELTVVSITGTCYQRSTLHLNSSHAHVKFIAGPRGGTISGGLSVPPLAWRPAGCGGCRASGKRLSSQGLER